MTDLRAYAHTLHTAGYTPLPVRPDGSKAPAVAWRDHQDTRPTPEQIDQWFHDGVTGIGVLTGAASGNLEMIELEGRAVTAGTLAELITHLENNGAGDLWRRIAAGWVEVTPSAGMHWHYRVNDGPAARNTKLARTPDRDVLIETRGEGGFTVIAPSAGTTHPTGNAWRTIAGNPHTVPTITTAERDQLHAIATLLDQQPPEPTPEPRPLRVVLGDEGLRPGDDYNQRATWDNVLAPHGWTRTHGGNGFTSWRKPDKHGPGISATTGRNDADNLYVFSTSTEFEPERPYSKFSAYTLLEHGGDYRAAARTLADQGYGRRAPISPPPPTPPPAAAPTRHLTTVTDGNTARALEPPPPAAHHADDYGPTEDGTARHLVDTHRNQLRYCPQRGQWLTWTGSRWAWDDADHTRELARAIARDLPEDDGWKSYKKRALSAAGVTGILRLAQSDPAVVVHLNQLDARPYELNTPGGIIDLRTGTLRPAEPDALHTRTTAVTPDFDRRSDLFDQFLHSTFGGNTDLTAYVQRMLGLSAIGTVLEQLLPFGQGPGANGKSTLLEAAMHVLGRGEGGYAISAPSEMLMVRRHSEHPAEIAQLAGARLVVCSELDDGQKFAEARIKQLTGRDSINARFMRRDPFTFTPTHTIWLLGNHQPAAATGGAAFWRRLKLIQFAHVVPEGQRDPALGEKLENDGAAVLAWIAQGAAAYLTAGMREPTAVTSATARYAADQDTIGRFVEEECRIGGGDAVTITVTRLRESYEAWCRQAGETAVSAKRLGEELRDRFDVGGSRTPKARMYTNVSLLHGDDQGFGDDA